MTNDIDKDFDGNDLPKLWGNEILTVKELKEILEDYPDDAIVYMEAVNAHIKNNTN